MDEYSEETDGRYILEVVQHSCKDTDLDGMKDSARKRIHIGEFNG